MNKYFIGFLIVILVIIYFLIKNENENFDTLIKENIILTNILNVQYTIIGGDGNKVLLISFPTRDTPATIYKILDDIKQENYYYIYNNGKIMSCIDDKLYFNQTKVNIITSSNDSYKYKLYKTSDDKLYFLINNKMMYLSASKKDFAIELGITADIKQALIWQL